MADDITTAELGRQLERWVHDIREDLADMRTRQEQYVLQRVYAAEQQVTNLRIGQLEARVKDGEDQRRASFRWVVTAVVVPTLTTIFGLILPAVLK